MPARLCIPWHPQHGCLLNASPIKEMHICPSKHQRKTVGSAHASQILGLTAGRAPSFVQAPTKDSQQCTRAHASQLLGLTAGRAPLFVQVPTQDSRQCTRAHASQLPFNGTSVLLGTSAKQSAVHTCTRKPALVSYHLRSFRHSAKQSAVHTCTRKPAPV